MAFQWYALRAKPNKEPALWQEVCARGYQAFYPQILVQPINPRSRTVQPYFPGYIFVQIDLRASGLSALAWLPYSCGLVSFGIEPSPIPNELIDAIRQRVDQVNRAGGEMLDGLRTGDTVRIHAGPFHGYQVIFDAHLPGSERVRVLLQLLSKQQIPLELPAGQIRRVNSPLGIGR